jgi:site-specific DNA-cytosine methylase
MILTDKQKSDGITVLSLFDGMSCGLIALKRAGIKVKNYFASEVDKPAMQIAKKNHSEIVHIGDVTKVKYNDGNLETEFGTFKTDAIDLVVGGSPCQGFSFAGKRLNFDDPRSKLFFEYVRLVKETNPKWFLLENVKMKQECQDIISEQMGVSPAFINSKLLSAQSRPRLYWTNIDFDKNIEDKGLKLSDIVLDNSVVLPKFFLSDKAKGYMSNKWGEKTRWDAYDNWLDGKVRCLTANMYKGVPYGVVKELDRRLTPLECERLQTLPDNYTDGTNDSQRYKMIGNGWTVDVIAHIFKGLI